MYFPGDPLFALDPIYQSIADQEARDAAGRDLRPRRDPARVGHRLPLGHRADRRAAHLDGGRGATPMSRPARRRRPARRSARSSATPCRTPAASELVPPRPPGAVRLHGTVLRRRRRPGPRRAARDLAGRRRRRSCPQPRARCARDGWTFTGWGRAAVDGNAAATRSPRVRPGPTGTGRRRVLRDDRLRPRPDQPAVHPGLPAGRRRGAGRATRCWPRCPEERRRRCWPRRRRRRAALRHPAAGRRRDRVPDLPGT